MSSIEGGISGSGDDWLTDSDAGDYDLLVDDGNAVDDLTIVDDDGDGNGGGSGSSGDGSSAGGDSNSNDSDNADANGLTFPSLKADIKAVMTSLGRDQATVASKVTSLTSEQIDKFQSEMSKQYAKNINKLYKMRDAAESAEFWSEVAKYAGYTAAGLTILAGFCTCNPVLMVAGGCMMATMILNDSGATQAMMDELGPVAGTIIIGSVILAASLATGGLAGATMFTTLAPGLLVTQENLESFGVPPDTAMWTSIGVGVGTSLLCGFGMARMGTVGSTAATTTTKTGAQAGSNSAANAANASAKVSSSGTQMSAKAGAQAANAKAGAQASNAKTGVQATSAKGGSAALSGADDAASVASSASRSNSAIDDASQAANQVNDAAQDAVQHADEAMNAVSQSRMTRILEGGKELVVAGGKKAVAGAKWVARGRVEQAMQRKMLDIATRASSFSGGSSIVNANNMARLSAYTAMATGILDMSTAGMHGATTKFNYDTKILQANAELSDAVHEYASTKTEAWTAMYTEAASSFNNSLSTTADIINTIHEATQGHQRFTV